MKKNYNSPRSLVKKIAPIFVAFLSSNFYSNAADICITANTNSSSLVITASDNLYISKSATLTVNSNFSCASIQIGANNGMGCVTNATKGNGSLVFSNGLQITVSGNVTLGNSTYGGTIDMTLGGTIVTSSLVVAGTGTKTWVPGIGTIRLTANNSIPSTIFTSFNNLTIGSGTTTLTAAISVKNLTINGALNSFNGNLNVTGNYLNNGTFSHGSGTVSFIGSNPQIVGGSNSSSFHNMVVNNTSTGSGLTLTAPINVLNNLNMIIGDIITTSTEILTVGVGSVATINFTDGSVIGPMRRWMAASSNSGLQSGIFPVGISYYNKWIMLEYTTAPTTAGYLTVEYKNSDPNATSAGTNGLPLDDGTVIVNHIALEGYWEVAPTTLSGGVYDLTIRGKKFESIYDYTKTRIIKSPDPHSIWTLNGIHNSIVGSYIDFNIKNTGMSGFSYFALGFPDASGLPSELLSFSASCTENLEVEIKWQTGSENDLDYFNVERSSDGVNWNLIQSVNASGNTNSTVSYTVWDDKIEKELYYYRLSQYDENGSSKQFDPISSECDFTNSENRITISPNPSEQTIHLEFISSDKNDNTEITLSDSKGQILFKSTVMVVNGINNYHLSNLNLAPGIYYFQISNDNFVSKNIKHIIQ